MKRKLLIFSVLAICATLLAAGTIAFFNAEGKAHNVITTGGVGITVQEWADEARETPFEDLDGILPGGPLPSFFRCGFSHRKGLYQVPP